MSFPEIDFDQALNPKSGDVYRQMGLDLVIIEATEIDLSFVCRNGAYTAPVRQIPIESFRRGVLQGVIVPRGA